MIEYFVSIRSIDRVYGTPSRYTVRLPCMINNAHKIEFVSAEIPNTLFTTKLRTMYFTMNDIPYVVPIMPGVYETSDLMTYMTSNVYVLSIVPHHEYENGPVHVHVLVQRTHVQNRVRVFSLRHIYHDRSSHGPHVRIQYIILVHHLEHPSVVSNLFYGDRLVAMDVPSYVYLTLEQLNDGDALNFITSSSTFMPPNVIARIQMNADILHMVNASPNSFDFVRTMNLIHPVNIDRLSISFVGPNGVGGRFPGSGALSSSEDIYRQVGERDDVIRPRPDETDILEIRTTRRPQEKRGHPSDPGTQKEERESRPGREG